MLSGFSKEEFIRALNEMIPRIARAPEPPVAPRYVVLQHYCGEQNRRHKKRRINKKWRKRYGCWYGPLPGKFDCYVIGDTILMTAEVYRRMTGHVFHWRNKPVEFSFDAKDVASPGRLMWTAQRTGQNGGCLW